MYQKELTIYHNLAKELAVYLPNEMNGLAVLGELYIASQRIDDAMKTYEICLRIHCVLTQADYNPSDSFMSMAVELIRIGKLHSGT